MTDIPSELFYILKRRGVFSKGTFRDVCAWFLCRTGSLCSLCWSTCSAHSPHAGYETIMSMSSTSRILLHDEQAPGWGTAFPPPSIPPTRPSMYLDSTLGESTLRVQSGDGVYQGGTTRPENIHYITLDDSHSCTEKMGIY